MSTDCELLAGYALAVTVSDDDYAEVVAACADIIAGKAAERRRDVAVWRLAREDGVPVQQIPVRLREELLKHFTDDEIKLCGLSYGNVRLIVSRIRPEDVSDREGSVTP